MKVVGIIPARWGSTRFPGKSLAPIAGKPLIQWVWENARRASKLERVLIATDDSRIADAALAFGAETAMTRSDHPSGTDRIAEAAVGADAVINIQGDEPLIDPALIDALAGTIANQRWDMATAAAPIADAKDLNSTSVVKVVWGQDGGALYFSRSVIPFVRDNDMGGAGPLHWRHIGIYAYTAAFLRKFVATQPCLLEKAEKLEQLRALHIGGRIAVIRTAECGIGVDTPDDVEYVEQELKRRAMR